MLWSLALILGVLGGAAPAQATVDNLRYCVTSFADWQVFAGNLPARHPRRTSCSFAAATYRAADFEAEVPYEIRVRGERLSCVPRVDPASEIRCRSARRYVLLYGGDGEDHPFPPQACRGIPGWRVPLAYGAVPCWAARAVARALSRRPLRTGRTVFANGLPVRCAGYAAGAPRVEGWQFRCRWVGFRDWVHLWHPTVPGQ